MSNDRATSRARSASAVRIGPDSRARVRPLSATGSQVTGGHWYRLQRLNSEVTLGEATRRLREAGNLDNLRLAAGEHSGSYRGPVYLDSDVYKTLEAIAWEQGRCPSPELAAWQREVSELISRAQAPDGYLNSYVRVVTGDRGRYADLPGGHELFCGGHLLQAAVAQVRATGESTLLEVAVRYADHLLATFGPHGIASTDGHPEIEMALVELYRETSQTAYLELARFLIDVRGHGVLGPGWLGSAYYQDDTPVRDARVVRGHAVRAVFLAAGATDLYLETGEESLLAAVSAQWEDMVAGKTYLTGGIGARWEGESFGNAFELPPDVAYAETCAAHGAILWSWRMLLATGEQRYAEFIERALYNGFAAGLSADGARFFYVNTLHNRPGSADTSSRVAARGRQPWYTTACCPPNVMRMLASVHHYLATCDDDGLQLHQYATGSLTADLPVGAVGLTVETGYPDTGTITITVDETPEADWTLSLRIPDWAEDATVHVAGQPLDPPVRAGTSPRLRRAWSPGDVVVLDLPLRPRLTIADARIDAVRGCVAIERGPVVYCVEQIDLPPGVGLERVELLMSAALSEHRDPQLLGGVTTITVPARVMPDTETEVGLPYREAVEHQASAHADPRADPGADRAVSVTAVPYASWANRDVGPMRVFLPLAPPRPENSHAISKEIP